MKRGRGDRPKVVSVERYILPPPVVVYVIDSPLIQDTSLHSLSETLSALEEFKSLLTKNVHKLVAGHGTYNESLTKIAASLLRLRSNIALSILQATHTIPRNAVEAGGLQKFFLRLVTASGILYSMSDVAQADTLMKLALVEAETLQVARRIFEGRDEWAKLASYVGDDIAVLMKEFRTGASDLKTIIEEIGKVVSHEIQLALSYMSKLPKSETSQKLLEELDEELEVLEREVLSEVRSR